MGQGTVEPWKMGVLGVKKGGGEELLVRMVVFSSLVRNSSRLISLCFGNQVALLGGEKYF